MQYSLRTLTRPREIADACSFGAVELCDGIDQDCNGVVDDGATDATTYFADVDGDGFGDSAAPVTACDAPQGTVADGTDCDDRDAALNPGALEADCTDPVDYNCDGSTGYADADGDGVPACEDCDDTKADVHPGAVESCNGVDDNCDGATDEAGAAGEQRFFADADGDGFGDVFVDAMACAQPTGFVVDATDCDDTASAAHPGGVEVCDTLDNDCDGSIDDANANDATLWFADADQDSYGEPGSAVRACVAPQGFVDRAQDCADNDPSAFPGGTEVCDGADNNCDGVVDEGVTTTWYGDGDGDGHGTPSVKVNACAAPQGFVSSKDDCADGDAAVHPGANEVCNDIDDDCDQLLDDADASWDATTGVQSWADADGDTFGDPATATSTCLVPSGSVENGDDCDDTDADVNPIAIEIWYDGVDQDCDNAHDDDKDGDGHASDAHGGDDTDDEDAACWQNCIPVKRVFVTKASYTGNLGGLVGADAKCQTSANAAGLPGTFKAWLSDNTGSPSTRFTRPTNAKYELVDGTVIATGWADLTDGTIASAINLTEYGVAPVSTGIACWPFPAIAWSNTNGNGAQASSGSSCSNWTSTSGGSYWGSTTETSGGAWSAWCNGGICSWTAFLYCFEQ